MQERKTDRYIATSINRSIVTFIRIRLLPELPVIRSIERSFDQLNRSLRLIGSLSHRVNQISVDDEHSNIPVFDTLECTNKSTSFLSVENRQLTENDLCRINNIRPYGIEAVLLSDKPALYRISVHDILGREVFSSTYPVDEGKTNIRMNFRLKPMVYIVRVSDGKNTEIKKIIRPTR